MEHEVGGEVGVDLVLPFACHLELLDPDESGNEFVSAAVPGDHGPSLGLPARSDKHSAGGDACPHQPVMTTGARTCAAPDPEHMPPNTAGTDNDTTDRTHTEPIITEAERTQVPGVAPVADVASARRHPVIRTK
jgi:hypothetical protein